MGNISRLGGVAAIIAMAGATAVVRDSEADPSGMPRGCPLRYPGQREESARISTSSNIQLQDELDAAHAQIEKLMMQVDSLKQGCVDATSVDGCPAGCTSNNTDNGESDNGEFILCNGASCLF